MARRMASAAQSSIYREQYDVDADDLLPFASALVQAREALTVEQEVHFETRARNAMDFDLTVCACGCGWPCEYAERISAALAAIAKLEEEK
jgi:hypothetical protein